MASTARQSKPQRKGGAPEPARNRPQGAWANNARTSSTFSASPAPRPTNGASTGSFPPLGQANGARQPDPQQERDLKSLSGLKGTTITLTTKNTQRYEGVIASVTTEGDNAGVTLKEVREISSTNAPTKDTLFIASNNIESWASGPAGSKMPSAIPNGDSFRTDTDISGKGGARRERELQAWQPSGSDATSTNNEGAGLGDDLTFGPGSGNASWDQFSANEKLFGVKTGFDEDLYTTKLDRSAPDFKEKERRAQKIANEIIGASTSNPHVAEERTMNLVDDSGMNEEDKYGAVVRGQNAYIPPGARKPGSNVGAAAAPSLTKQQPQEIPKVSINGPDGAVKPSPQSPSPPAANAVKGVIPSAPAAGANKPPADPLPAFRDFVTNERQRLTQKKQALVKNEMDKRMAELVKFSQSFKLNKPIPEDLVPILAKDEEKQNQIREKAIAEAASSQARTIGGSADPTPKGSAQIDGVKKVVTPGPPSTGGGANGNKSGVASVGAKPSLSGSGAGAAGAKPAEPAKKPSLKMVIQAIPPFKGPKMRQTLPTVGGGSNAGGSALGPVKVANLAAVSGAGSNGAAGAPPVSPTTANRLNVNASSFRPNPKASAFSPVSVSPAASANASASVSPKPKHETVATSTNNPFFGQRPVKKQIPVNIKDDFNPFKHNKVAEAKDVTAMWPYSGKRYMQMFPPPQHQPAQHAAHVAPPGPPPMPPQTYEEDPAAQAAQAAQRGYVYAYPPYGYPAQHMMPGMAPPGPPGAYMPGPFMQHMPYPPAMYSPAMGQMPPPQAYMPPPPHQGAYAPPPNGAGPRPSMPPTPIPAHAHPYYHQSPQLQHAVPYMMMPPPQPGVPPHPYDGSAPPVPMGHA